MPFLVIDHWFSRDNVSICLLSALSSGDEKSDFIFLDHADQMTIPEIAQKVHSLSRSVSEASSKSNHDSCGQFLWNIFRLCPKADNKTALVIISPDTERSKLDMAVSPPSTNATVVIGGVRVMKRENKKVYTLSISITVNCARSSVGMCRRFAECLQKFLQDPEKL